MEFPFVNILEGKDAAAFGKNATNGLFGVDIVDIVQPHESWIGILAQELFEVEWKWSKWLLPCFSKSYTQEMEIISHTVESIVAKRLDGFDLTTYMLLEAKALKQSYGTLFNDETEDGIYKRMKTVSGIAEAWVNDNWSKLQAYQTVRKAKAA